MDVPLEVPDSMASFTALRHLTLREAFALASSRSLPALPPSLRRGASSSFTSAFISFALANNMSLIAAPWQEVSWQRSRHALCAPAKRGSKIDFPLSCEASCSYFPQSAVSMLAASGIDWPRLLSGVDPHFTQVTRVRSRPCRQARLRAAGLRPGRSDGADAAGIPRLQQPPAPRRATATDAR